MEASAIKRKQLKKEKERKAGNKEPSIDMDTGLNAQDNETELNSTEDLVDAQKLAPEKEPVIDQDSGFGGFWWLDWPMQNWDIIVFAFLRLLRKE